jgi:hypothetical protein
MKMIAYGLLFTGQYAYLRIGWNILDLVVVMASILALVLMNLMNPGYIMWLRILRALR